MHIFVLFLVTINIIHVYMRFCALRSLYQEYYMTFVIDLILICKLSFLGTENSILKLKTKTARNFLVYFLQGHDKSGTIEIDCRSPIAPHG